MTDSGWIAFLPLIATPATNSGQVVFLPLVGAILGAVVGAFGGAWANSWYRDREAKKAEDRERKGLLILIDVEIFDNNKHLKNCVEDEAALFDLLTINRLETETWHSSRVRLTQLLSPVAVHALAVYYIMITEIHQAVESTATPRNQSTAAVLSKRAEREIELGDTARQLIHREYIKEPDYLIPIPERPDIPDKD